MPTADRDSLLRGIVNQWTSHKSIDNHNSVETTASMQVSDRCLIILTVFFISLIVLSNLKSASLHCNYYKSALKSDLTTLGATPRRSKIIVGGGGVRLANGCIFTRRDKIVCVDCLLAMLNVVWIKSFYRMVMTYPCLVI